MLMRRRASLHLLKEGGIQHHRNSQVNLAVIVVIMGFFHWSSTTSSTIGNPTEPTPTLTKLPTVVVVVVFVIVDIDLEVVLL